MMIIIIPIISYAGADVLLETFREDLPLPLELARSVTIPFIGTVDMLFAKIAVAVVIMIALFALLSIFYSILYSATGPGRYGPLDVPPERYVPAKKRKRR